MKINESYMLYTVIFSLILILFALMIGIVNSTFDFTFVLGFESDFWNPASTFLGALLGALITGGLALLINKKESERLKNAEIQKSMKIIRLLNYYSVNLIDEIESIFLAENSYQAIKDPMSDVPIIETGPNQFGPLYWPNEEIENYERLIKPFLNIRKKSAEKFIVEYRKFREINIDNLNFEKLDEYLRLMSDITKHVLPVIYEISDKSKRKIKGKEKEKVLSIFKELELFLNY